MGTQGTGRKRNPNKDRSTAEDDALNLISREAEARLAAKRAARAEAREIRMKELERQQKEIYQVQKKYYGLDNKSDKVDSEWGHIEQWMEDSERYSRPTQRHTSISDDDERMSVGSRGSVRSDLDAIGAYGRGEKDKKSKKKKKHKDKRKDRDSNGYDNEYSAISSRSSRLGDESTSRVSRSSRLDLQPSSGLSDESISKVSRSSRLDLQPASYASSDLNSNNGLSSSRQRLSSYESSGLLSQISYRRHHRGSLYEDSLYSGSRRVTGSSSRHSEYNSYRGSGSRASSRASSARASPVDNDCNSVASFLRSAATSSGLPRDLDHMTIPNLSDVEDRDYLEKGSRAASTLSAATLASLGGSSSRGESGETSITGDTETSIREIKDTLVEVEEKYRKAMVSNAQLDNEKNNLMYQVDTLKDSLMELEELLSESRREYEGKSKDFEREKHAHGVLQFQFKEMKETLKQSEELLTEIRQMRLKQDGFVREISDLQETVEWKDKKIGALERQKEYSDAIRNERDELRDEVVQLKDILKKHGIVLRPDLTANGEMLELGTEGSASGDPASQLAQDSQTSPMEGGNSMLEIRLRKLVDERENLIGQVKKLKAQVEQKKPRNEIEEDSSPEGEVLENGTDPHIQDLQRDASRQLSDLKFKLVKSEQEVTALEQNVTRLEGQVTRYKGASENSEKVEDELKAEKRKLQRELRSALDKIDELESNNSHLSKRLDKMKANRSTATTP
ncbi:leucine-rich repeat flightless-interacting protein 2-like isoform X17 [Oncorhynchus nerka]|uniref:leucine-rich repeat flightless-interacting protein 2-like isoform X17 n=1 Tax=Oncorhynchus nerka TaxID=8023 RepID=UPI0031B81EA0